MPGHVPLFRLGAGIVPDVPVELDGVPVAALRGETVAALLLRVAGPAEYRHDQRTGASRAPLCMMGVCFECLVTVDGQSNQQGCLMPVRAGMQIVRQRGAP